MMSRTLIDKRMFGSYRSSLISGAFLTVSALANPAFAQTQEEATSVVRLGLDPGEPQAPSPPPSVPFGVQPAQSKELVLDFHGYLLMPLEVGVLQRPTAVAGESRVALHAPPSIPQYQESFEYTGVIPAPWAQLNFTYGNSTVSATTILAATAFADASGYYDPAAQLGVNDAFLTVNVSKMANFQFPFEVHVGAMTGRYGAMGSYDAGRYGTPLIARINTVGETIDTALPLGSSLKLLLEQGFGGQLARPPEGLVPAGWNGFANADVGATFINHLHAGLADGKHFQIGLHYLTAWTQDDQTNQGLVPDGRITVFGAEAHFMGRFGHLYLGTADVQAVNSASVSGAIQILNAQGGPDLISQYLGPNSNGNGGLQIAGAQYDLSVARLIYGKTYTGKSADVLLSLFGVGARVSSHDPNFDGVFKVKAGAEVTYDFLPWMGVSERFDHVRLDGSNSSQAMSILSSRLLFHTSWLAREEVALQYSYFSDGFNVYVRSGYPPVVDPSITPDASVFSLIGTIWW